MGVNYNPTIPVDHLAFCLDFGNPKINKGRFELSKKYFEFLKDRTKFKKDKERKNLVFK